jgi:hypothetical protein
MTIDTLLDEYIEDHDDSDSSATYEDWLALLPLDVQQWSCQQHAREPETDTQEKTISDHLELIEAMLARLLDREQTKDYYAIEEFARLVGKAEFTCREWCRLGRIQATKKNSGRGKYQAWVVSHEELLRYQKEGLLPQPR